MPQSAVRRRPFVVVTAMFVGLSAGSLPACGGRPVPASGEITAEDLVSVEQRGAYVAAYEMGRNLREQGVLVDPSLLERGLLDGFSNARPLLGEAQIHEAMLAFGEKLERRQRQRAADTAERNRSEGEAYLRSNRERPGVVELPNGLQYEVLREGTGRRPAASDRVMVRYEGRLLDGTVFNTSEGMGRPMSFTVNEVIPGWREALLMMREGARWRIYLPPRLAFGEQAPSPVVGADATVIFDVELLSVE